MHTHAILVMLLSAASATAAYADRTLPADPVLRLNDSAPSLVLPGSGWTVHQERRNRSDTGIYYMLSNEKLQSYFSVYIERTDACSAAKECLKLALKNDGYAKAEGRTEFDATPFAAASFYTDGPRGLPIQQAHILASAYVDGHWIDIHLSAAAPERPSVEPLRVLLQTVVLHDAP